MPAYLVSVGGGLILSSLPLRKVFCLVEGNSSIVAHHLGRFSSVWFLLSFLMQENLLLPMPISSCSEEGPKIAFRVESFLLRVNFPILFLLS